MTFKLARCTTWSINIQICTPRTRLSCARPPRSGTVDLVVFPPPFWTGRGDRPRASPLAPFLVSPSPHCDRVKSHAETDRLDHLSSSSDSGSNHPLAITSPYPPARARSTHESSSSPVHCFEELGSSRRRSFFFQVLFFLTDGFFFDFLIF